VFSPNATTLTAFNESFDEGVDIGYRWYQSYGQTPLFPFGYGLSYTRFSYGPLWLRRGGRGTYTATTTIRNTGSQPGAEVPQLYLHYPSGAGEAR
jgi:beta-glucosidase